MTAEQMSIKIGDATYIGLKYNNPELQKLILQWQQFNYNKFSGIIEQMEWAIVEAIHIEEFELNYISSSNIEYPSLPTDDVNKVKKIIASVKKAKRILKEFELPKRKPKESRRVYMARVADKLETHLKSKIQLFDASIVADSFLARAINDPPIGYDE